MDIGSGCRRVHRPWTPRAQESERAVAQWIIRLNGSVTLEPNAEPVRDLAKLPAGIFTLSVSISPAHWSSRSSFSGCRVWLI